MSYIDVTGKTEEEAIRKGLEQLGMDRDDVSVEILERAKNGFLGIGSNPARVRLTYGPEEAPVAEPAPVVKPVVQKPAAEKEQKPAKPAAPKAAEKPARRRRRSPPSTCLFARTTTPGASWTLSPACWSTWTARRR